MRITCPLTVSVKHSSSLKFGVKNFMLRDVGSAQTGNKLFSFNSPLAYNFLVASSAADRLASSFCDCQVPYKRNYNFFNLINNFLINMIYVDYTIKNNKTILQHKVNRQSISTYMVPSLGLSVTE